VSNTDKFILDLGTQTYSTIFPFLERPLNADKVPHLWRSTLNEIAVNLLWRIEELKSVSQTEMLQIDISKLAESVGCTKGTTGQIVEHMTGALFAMLATPHLVEIDRNVYRLTTLDGRIYSEHITSMTNALPFSMTGDSVTVFVDGTPHTHHAGTVQYNQIQKAILEKDWAGIPALLAPGGALQKYLGTAFALDNGVVKYNGTALPPALSDRINAMASAGQDPSPLLRFYERLDKNPSYRSREQVFGFLQHLNIAIEPDGTFLAYKGLRDDYLDVYSGTISNKPGAVVKMPRNQISDNPSQTCHVGLHVGARSYAHGFGYGTTVVVRVDPENVVCVPEDHNAQKMRVCEYEVIGDWSGQDMTAVADDSDLPDEEYEVDVDDIDEESETEKYTYRVRWSEEDQEHVGLVAEFPSLSWFAGTPGEALNGITKLVAEVLVDMAKSKETPPEPLSTQEEFPPVTAAQTSMFEKVDYPLDRMNTRELMEQPIENLRKYASGRLKIHGASKIPGGKSTLVAKIMKVRRRLAK